MILSMAVFPILTFSYHLDYDTGQVLTTQIYLPLFWVDTIITGTQVAMGIYIVGLISFMMWTYRAAGNSRALGAIGMRTSPGWAVGWYFIPILSFWKPYQAAIEIWRASNAPLSASRPETPTYLIIWWITSVLGNIASNIILRFETVSAEGFAAEPFLLGAELVLLMISLSLTIRFVRETAAAQTKDHMAEVFS